MLTWGLVMDNSQFNGDFNRDCAQGKAIDSPFLNTEEAAQFVRLNKRTLENMRSYGDGPIFRKHGNRVYYHIDDLNEWSSERSQANI